MVEIFLFEIIGKWKDPKIKSQQKKKVLESLFERWKLNFFDFNTGRALFFRNPSCFTNPLQAKQIDLNFFFAEIFLFTI
jgi:hypothetical protein